MLPDLTGLPCVPCGVRIERWNARGMIRFVKHYEDEVARRVEKGGMTPFDDDGKHTECGICLSPLDGPAHGTPKWWQRAESAEVVAIVDGNPGTCGHVFHTECLRKQTNMGGPNAFRCPTCRAPFAMSIFDGLIELPK